MSMNTKDWLSYLENWKSDYLEQNLGASEGDYWHPQDKSWMAERKAQWRDVKESLDVLSAGWAPFKRKFHKYHKELFFFGTLNPDCRRDGDIRRASPIERFITTGHEPFLGELPMFRIWYHPEPAAIDLGALRESYLKHARLQTIHEDFFKYWSAGAGLRGKAYLPSYGMMGGREERVVRFLFPGLDYQKSFMEGQDRQDYGASTRPYHMMLTCYAGTVKELRMDATFIPNAPGQYLWDQMSFNLEQYPDIVFADEELRGVSKSEAEYWRSIFKVIIAELLTFDKRQDRSRNRPSTIAMVERLINQYERREFSDAMLDLWDESKKEVEVLNKMDRHLFYEDAEKLAARYDLTVDELNKRVEQWKQV